MDTVGSTSPRIPTQDPGVPDETGSPVNPCFLGHLEQELMEPGPSLRSPVRREATAPVVDTPATEVPKALAAATPPEASLIDKLENTVPPFVRPALVGNLPPMFLPLVLATKSAHDIVSAASKMGGRQYWPNSCAHAVNDCLKHLGIDITPHTKGNPNWVPNYAHLGQKVDKLADLQPGDLVIYHSSQGGYDHIGIYAGDGQAWNVSSAHSHKWTKTPIGRHFQEGRRIAT